LFADINKREADLALLFFSNNTETIRKVSGEYGVNNALIISGYGGEYRTSLEYEQILKENGVRYVKEPFNYGDCYETGHCEKFMTIKAGSTHVSNAFLSVYNETYVFQLDKTLFYFLIKGNPDWLPKRNADIFTRKTYSSELFGTQKTKPMQLETEN
ncbi:MAG TPA: hypothetical protein VI612_01045, partial [Candidatus Nanoarchaeia archaeon]|nr:hypothetical protein [Candidatus Nanoarchaeia archaeon]